MLIITTVPAAHCTPLDRDQAGKNRFECRTCPYQMVLDRRYYERKNMTLKPVEDILGGADSWKNVDKTEGEFFITIAVSCSLFFLSTSLNHPNDC
jgi:DNA-directed RNA polymerase III subunit RPC11